MLEINCIGLRDFAGITSGKMFWKKNMLLLLVLCGLLCSISAQEAECEKCMDNFAYCVDENHFYVCIDGTNPSRSDGPHECPAGTFCTNSDNICDVEIPPTITKGCSGNNNGNCNACSGQFACVSKTQFALCRNNMPTSILSSCGTDLVCSIDLFKMGGTQRKICAPQVVLDFFGYTATCSNDQTTTAPPPTTINPSSLITQCEKAEAGQEGRFYYIKNDDDTTCQSYIYCERLNSNMEAILFKCTRGYWDTTSKACVETKPQNC